jgi:hypothetical protein
VGRGQAGAERRRGQGSGQGGGPAPAAEREAEEQRVCRGRRRGKSPRTGLENLESSGVSR